MVTVGGIREKQALVEGSVEVRGYLSLTISADHNRRRRRCCRALHPTDERADRKRLWAERLVRMKEPGRRHAAS